MAAAPVSKVWQLRFQAVLVLPISIWPMKQSSCLQSLASQLRIPVESVAFLDSESDGGTTVITVELRTGNQLKHASALALLDVMRAGGPYGSVEWAHITVSKIWNAKQHEMESSITKHGQMLGQQHGLVDWDCGLQLVSRQL